MSTVFQIDFRTSSGAVSSRDPADNFYAVLLGMAGHDLRQPLQVLQSTYEMLNSQVGLGAGRAQVARGQRAILSLSKQLDQIVNAMRLQELNSDIFLAPVPIQAILSAVRGDLLEFATSRSIQLRLCPTSAIVLSNPVALEGMIRNLVHNAIKYTPPEGKILIGCRRRLGEVHIYVCDTGPGIANVQLAEAFEPFNRLNAEHGDGLGLGLYVVQRAAAIMKHRIEVCSRLGHGSRFSIVARCSREADRTS